MADADDLILLGAYQDGELSPGEALAMERRLAAEPDLRALLARLGGLSGAVRATLAEVAPSERLRDRALRAIGDAGAVPPRPALRRLAPAWRALAACLAVGLGLGGLLGAGTAVLVRPGGEAPVAAAVLAGHLRGLAAAQPFDIASSDRHVVKPWFNGRTTIAPSAPDLADKGFPLLGGRVDVIGERTVPTLVYGRDKHLISVTIVPRAAGTPAAEEHRDGSTLLGWTAGDLAYYVASDLNTRDLRSFADLFRQRM